MARTLRPNSSRHSTALTSSLQRTIRSTLTSSQRRMNIWKNYNILLLLASRLVPLELEEVLDLSLRFVVHDVLVLVCAIVSRERTRFI
jgi:hypothetical protein